MKPLRFVRCLAFALGVSWACGVASAIDLGTLATRVEWNASAFRTAIVCDQPGRPTVVLPEVITQKVQESFRTNELVYFQESLSMSEREDHASLESYRLPTDYYGQVYRYSLPNDNSRFLFVYSQIRNEVSKRVSFWIYDSTSGQASASSAAQSTRWLNSDIENGARTNRLGDPYVTFVDIDQDDVPEVVSYEAEHAGTDDWQLYYHYYRVDPDLSLHRVRTRPAYVEVFVPKRYRGTLQSQVVPLGKHRVRIDVQARGLPPWQDGTVVASYTCERRAMNLPFQLIERRIEMIADLNLWKRELGFFDQAIAGR